jgi:hypothetical protein
MGELQHGDNGRIGDRAGGLCGLGTILTWRRNGAGSGGIFLGGVGDLSSHFIRDQDQGGGKRAGRKKKVFFHGNLRRLIDQSDTERKSAFRPGGQIRRQGSRGASIDGFLMPLM